MKKFETNFYMFFTIFFVILVLIFSFLFYVMETDNVCYVNEVCVHELNLLNSTVYDYHECIGHFDLMIGAYNDCLNESTIERECVNTYLLKNEN